MKTFRIGDVNFGRFNTEVCVTDDVRKLLKSKKISEASLIPAGWVWYDAELFEALDEDGDGKPDEKFGKNFKMIYFLDSAEVKEFERGILLNSSTIIKDLRVRYVAVKNA